MASDSVASPTKMCDAPTGDIIQLDDMSNKRDVSPSSPAKKSSKKSSKPDLLSMMEAMSASLASLTRVVTRLDENDRKRAAHDISDSSDCESLQKRPKFSPHPDSADSASEAADDLIQNLSGGKTQTSCNDTASGSSGGARAAAAGKNGADSKAAGEGSLLSEIEQELDGEEQTDAEVDPTLASIVNKRFSAKLSDKNFRDKTEKYCRPANCDGLIPPKVNVEIWRKITHDTRSQDLRLVGFQKTIALAAASVTKLVNNVLVASKPGGEVNKDQIIRMGTDALAFMGHASYDLSLHRREGLRPLLGDYSSICSSDVPITDKLFGNDLQTVLANVRSSNKIGNTAVNNKNKNKGGNSLESELWPGSPPTPWQAFFRPEQPTIREIPFQQSLATQERQTVPKARPEVTVIEQLESLDEHHSKNAAEDTSGQGYRCTGCPRLAHTSMVPTITQHASPASIQASEGGNNSSARSKAGGETPATENPGVDGVPLIRQSLQNRGLSSPAREIIEQSWRQNTRKQYKPYLRKWEQYCASAGIDKFHPSVEDGINFLTELYQTGIGYSALNTARCALSSVIVVSDGRTFGAHALVCRFLRGVFCNRPSLPRYKTTWDVSVVLSYLCTLHPVNTLRLKDLTMKLVMLLALVTGQRCQTMHSLKINAMHMLEDKCVFVINSLLKTSKPGNHLSCLRLKAFDVDKRLCVLRCLKCYLDRTKYLRNAHNQLLLSYQKPFNPVSCDTIAIDRNILSIARRYCDFSLVGIWL